MKIAFVNQPIDTILPPNQNSVGACTYWVARQLAQTAQVLVYGLKDNHGDPAPWAEEPGIDFRFFPATRRDKWLFSVLKGSPSFFPAPRRSPLHDGCFPITGGKLRTI